VVVDLSQTVAADDREFSQTADSYDAMNTGRPGARGSSPRWPTTESSRLAEHDVQNDAGPYSVWPEVEKANGRVLAGLKVVDDDLAIGCTHTTQTAIAGFLFIRPDSVVPDKTQGAC
jgi:hypothetical protein